MKTRTEVSWDIEIVNQFINETEVIANCSKLGDALFLTELLEKDMSYHGKHINVKKKYTIVEDENPLLDEHIQALENDWNEFKKTLKS